MLRKHIRVALLLLAVVLPLTIFGSIHTAGQMRIFSRGSYFFEKTRENADILSVSITFPGGKTITVEKKDSFWRIKEADDYFASFAKVNALIALIRNTVIYRADALNSDSPLQISDAIRIASSDSHGNIVDDAYILPLKDGNSRHYALLNDDGYLYQLKGNFSLSSQVSDWLQMPLFSWDNRRIKRIKTDRFEVYRRTTGSDFRTAGSNKICPQIANLIGNFAYLVADDIRHASHFIPEKYQKAGYFEIYLFGGLVYKISLYHGEDGYWMRVRLDKGGLINKPSLNVMKENSILYDGWYFKINTDKGKLISGFVI